MVLHPDTLLWEGNLDFCGGAKTEREVVTALLQNRLEHERHFISNISLKAKITTGKIIRYYLKCIKNNGLI